MSSFSLVRSGMSSVGVSYSYSMARRCNAGHRRNVRRFSTTTQNIKNVIAIASCKGGVGKSSICVNLAYMLSSQLGKKVGVLDVDVYGPSLPYQIPDPPSTSGGRSASSGGSSPSSNPGSNPFTVTATKDGKINPVVVDDVKLMSLGFVRPDEFAALRGPMVSGIVSQLMTQTLWGELDYLLVDMPPGTGDIHLTVAQEPNLRISGAVMITTPQKLSLVDVEKGIRMFDSVSIPTVSIIENMSIFECPHCGKESSIYHSSSKASEDCTASPASSLASQFGIDSFHQLPIDQQLGIPKAVYCLRANQDRVAWKALKKAATDLVEIVEGVEGNSEKPGLHSLMARQAIPELVYDNSNENSITFKATVGGFKIADGTSSSTIPAENGSSSSTGSGSSYTLMEKRMPARKLRMLCRNADMVDEFTGEKIFDEKKIPINVHPKKIETAGRYATRITWSDGHVSLFPYKYLRKVFEEEV